METTDSIKKFGKCKEEYFFSRNSNYETKKIFVSG